MVLQLVALAWISSLQNEARPVWASSGRALSAGCSLTRKDAERSALPGTWRLTRSASWLSTSADGVHRLLSSGVEERHFPDFITSKHQVVSAPALKQIDLLPVPAFTIRSCERGDTALIQMGCEIFSLTGIDCGLGVRKPSIQWQMVGFRLRRKLFHQSLQHYY